MKVCLSLYVLASNEQMFSTRALQRGLNTQSHCGGEFTAQTTVQSLSDFLATENKLFVRTFP